MALGRLTQVLQDKALRSDDPDNFAKAAQIRQLFLNLEDSGIEDIPIEDAIRILKQGELGTKPIRFNSIDEIFEIFPIIERKVLIALYDAAFNNTNGQGNLTYSQLKEIVWPEIEIDDTTLSQTIRRIKNRLSRHNISLFAVQNVRNVGYQLKIKNTEG